ncbi:MAG: TetR/AcrR family transcriptional regulator [Paludibacteraceae bacterium]|nr:TetR/AcrR family transcriptional regulator [Paludibacteraceae bacterium]
MSKTTNEEIIQKAAMLFLVKGYDRTSIADIANAVGIQKPSLYSRFKSKEDIFRNTIDSYIIRMQKPENKFGEVPDISMKQFIDFYIARVEGVMDNYGTKFSQMTSFANRGFAFFLEIGRFDPKYAKIFPHINNEEINMWTKVIDMAKAKGELREDVDSINTAKIIRYSYVGLGFNSAIEAQVTGAEIKKLLYSIYDTIKK